MATLIEYAQLAARAYPRTLENQSAVPSGWTEVETPSNTNFSGFAAGVYQKGNEIVIAFTGTNDGAFRDFTLANIPAGFGVPSLQIIQAMALYMEVKLANPGEDITISFTGHSLGGGLASLMSVFFDEDATVFDQAPFELTALNPLAVNFYKQALLALGYVNGDFNVYAIDILASYLDRQDQVSSVYLEGEILTAARALWPDTAGSSQMVETGEQTYLSASPSLLKRQADVHSMALLTSMLTSESFRYLVQHTPTALELFFDSTLFKSDPESSQRASFIERLLISQMGESGTGSNAVPLLDRFAADVLTLLPDGAGTSALPGMQRGIVAAIMEYYYYTVDTDPAAFVTRIGNGAVLDLSLIADDNLNKNGQLRLLTELENLVDPIINSSAREWAAAASVWTVQGVVKTVSADSQSQAGANGTRGDQSDEAAGSSPLAFKAIVELAGQELRTQDFALPLAAGMQVSAEILEGKRTVLEYLLSPVQKVASEAGMER